MSPWIILKYIRYCRGVIYYKVVPQFVSVQLVNISTISRLGGFLWGLYLSIVFMGIFYKLTVHITGGAAPCIKGVSTKDHPRGSSDVTVTVTWGSP